MKLAFAVFAVAVLSPLLRAADDAPVTPTAKTELFNGRDFTGWKLFSSGDTDPKTVWSIENGVIKCVGSPNGYVRTEQTYKDYKLSVEFRFIQPGNTGFLVHMGLPDAVWPKCFECQGMYRHQGDLWLWGGADCREPKNPGKNGFVTTVKAKEIPVGEWNTYQVECAGDTIKITVNGKLKNTATGCNATSGSIGIQSEGAAIEVRKISIEPLGN